MNRKQARLERIEQLIDRLKGESDPLKIAELGQIEHDWLMENYKASSAGTFISSEYIPAIMTAYPASKGEDLLAHECWQKVNGVMVKRHRVISTLKPTIAEWNERNQATKKVGVTKANSKLPLYPERLIETAAELINRDSWNYIAAGLILLTGRRPTEIVWSGKFSPASPYTVLFSGQLKKGNLQPKAYEIPTLIEASLILFAYNRLRQLDKIKKEILKLESAQEVATKSNPQINQVVRSHFSKLLAPPHDNKGESNHLSASNLRAAYGKIVEYFYCPPTTEPIFFIGTILGHKSEDTDTKSIATTIHYSTYYIVNSMDKAIDERGIYADRLIGTSLAGQIIASGDRAKESHSCDRAIDDVPENAISGKDLADRLSIEISTVGRNRDKTEQHFISWSYELDPDGIAWKYIGKGKVKGSNRTTDLYVPTSPPIEETNIEGDKPTQKEAQEDRATTEAGENLEKELDRKSQSTDTQNDRATSQQRTTIDPDLNVDSSDDRHIEALPSEPDKISSDPADLSGSERSDIIVEVPEDAISGKDLALRLSKNMSTVGRNRDKTEQHFIRWSYELDPDGIAWKHIGSGKLKGSNRTTDLYVPTEFEVNLAEVETTEPNKDKSNKNKSQPSESIDTQNPKDYRANDSQDNDKQQQNASKSSIPSLDSNPNNLRSRFRENEINVSLSREDCDRLNGIAFALNLKGDTNSQLSQLFKWVETHLDRKETEFINSDRDKESAQLSKPNDRIAKSIADLAKFTEELGTTFEIKIGR